MWRIFILLLLAVEVCAQNLVPNGDFETYSDCPEEISEVYRAIPWRSPTFGSSDYFNTCLEDVPSGSILSADVPLNRFGSQEAFSGQGYAGFLSSKSVAPSPAPPIVSASHEYIEVELIDSMRVGTSYLVQFWYSYADNFNADVLTGVNKVQALFRTNSTVESFLTAIYEVPHIDGPEGPSLLDQENWNLHTETFVADEPYTHMIMGVFGDSSFIPNRGDNFISYYYVDDVSVTAVIAPDSNVYWPQAFSPNGDNINDVFGPTYTVAPNEYSFKVYDRWGKIIFETTAVDEGWDGTNDQEVFPTGLYVYWTQYLDEEHNLQEKIGRFQLLR